MSKLIGPENNCELNVNPNKLKWFPAGDIATGLEQKKPYKALSTWPWKMALISQQPAVSSWPRSSFFIVQNCQVYFFLLLECWAARCLGLTLGLIAKRCQLHHALWASSVWLRWRRWLWSLGTPTEKTTGSLPRGKRMAGRAKMVCSLVGCLSLDKLTVFSRKLAVQCNKIFSACKVRRSMA